MDCLINSSAISNGLSFNPEPPYLMHIDLNSCFASVEQQANPLLRGKPIAVAAYKTPSGCILAASIEAKKLGIKTGMRVKDGKLICPGLIVMEPDPNKYRTVHISLRNLLTNYTDVITPKSIDEFVLDLKHSPYIGKGMFTIAKEIKRRIREEIGDWLRVSIGIGPNRFLAKTAAGLTKPDGLDEINSNNYEEIYRRLKLTDLCGIAKANSLRLNTAGIYSVTDFYRAPVLQLRSAFHSVGAYYWYLRLRGWEIDTVDFTRKSFGNSVALGKTYATIDELSPILMKLVEKSSMRMRRANYKTRGIHLSLLYKDFSFYRHGQNISKPLFDPREIYKETLDIMIRSPYRKPVRDIAVSLFNLSKSETTQLEFFEDVSRKENLISAMDKVNEVFGDFVLTPATMLNMDNIVHDRIAFGGVKELEN